MVGLQRPIAWILHVEVNSRVAIEHSRSEVIARRYDRWSLDIALIGIPAGNSNVSVFTVPKYLIPFIYFEEVVKALADVCRRQKQRIGRQGYAAITQYLANVPKGYRFEFTLYEVQVSRVFENNCTYDIHENIEG